MEPTNNFETNTASFLRRGAQARASAPRPEMSRRVMDVEDVLSWAARDELPKDRGLGGHGEPAAVSGMFRMCAFGTRVDNWNREPGFPAAMGPPHPDALLVEAALERIVEETGQTVGCLDSELDLAPDLARLPIDQVQAVRRALVNLPTLVWTCAKLRERPYWRTTTKPRPMRHPNGHSMVVRWEPFLSRAIDGREVAHEALVQVEPKSKDVYPVDAYCPLRYDPDPQSIVEERAEYLVWWGAMNALATELEGKLATIAILPPAAAQRPWKNEVDLGKPPRLFQDLTARVYGGEDRQTDAAHRMLGLRRVSGARGSARRIGAPVRAARRATAAAAKTACGGS